MSDLEKFSMQVTERTKENYKAFELLFDKQLYGVCIGLLRQELDTLIRLNYLNVLEDNNKKIEIITKSVEKGLWGLNKRISDAEMKKNIPNNLGWANNVYEFGSRFIHLSGFHLYKLEDPITKIHTDELNKIIGYLEDKHGFKKVENLNFQHLLNYLPDVMEKIIENNLEELNILESTIC
ncbi:hypothetical protein BEN71_18960 [Acinetobacter wuhouensis]|uniref:hypothetical protein n=1 Tax=Acinetobacter wuhouensis TaxID=1879050 RepID=UPI00083A7A0D|nr:hypothetical protein [Acinetobacter wuhouensis]AXQ24000.1 hypothetical protein BEN71_18960 [Acinetobacter wuhouensis]RZG71383.1 hypothetical protein EXU29_14090 [Acinetobacter wuhouensis]